MIDIRGLADVEKDLAKRQADIKANGGKATKAYARVIQTAAKAKAIPKRKGLGTAKNQAKRRSASQWSRVPEPIVHANLPGHVKVYSDEPRMSKVRLTGRVWHLILGEVQAHEMVAGTFRGKASGRTALQMMTGGYARHAINPGHPAADNGHWLRNIAESVHVEASVAAKEALFNGRE